VLTTFVLNSLSFEKTEDKKNLRLKQVLRLPLSVLLVRQSSGILHGLKSLSWLLFFGVMYCFYFQGDFSIRLNLI